MSNAKEVNYAQLARKIIPMAEKGNIKAQFQLGLLFLNGKGVPKDYMQAANWFSKSALKGDVNSQYYIGAMYARGLGVSKNYYVAAEWLGKAAGLGHKKAEAMLAKLPDASRKKPANSIPNISPDNAESNQAEAKFSAKILTKILKGISFLLIILAVFVIYKILSEVVSLFSGMGIVSLSAGKIVSMFFSLFVWVFMKTFLYLLSPVAIYIVILALVRHPLLRFAAGIGSIYLFWIFSGGFSFQASILFSPSQILDAIIRIIRLIFQMYFLTVLVIPEKLMNLAGAAASFIGGILINAIPVGIPAVSFDDIAAMSVLTCFIMYLNTIALFVKRNAPYIDKVLVTVAHNIMRRT